MLLQKAGFPSFLVAEYYLIAYIYHIFFIHSPADKYLGCVRILAIVNNAVVNMGVQISPQDPVSTSFRYTPRCGMTQSHGSSPLNF